MRIPFRKMQALGNDFMIVRGDGLPVPGSGQIRRLADRRTGVGFDQLLWLEAPRRAGDDIHYRVYNADGSEAEQCGNGARCIALAIAGPGQTELRLGHASGTARARLGTDGQVTVEMAVPEFRPERIPFRAEGEAPTYVLEVGGEGVELGAVSMGNPHAVIRVTDVATAPVARLGPLLERHERFPNRANIGFVQVVASNRVRLRVYERGAGETQACGSGACAAVAVGRRWGLLDPDVTVELPGGNLRIHWQGPGQPVWMTGEAVNVFEGTVEA